MKLEDVLYWAGQTGFGLWTLLIIFNSLGVIMKVNRKQFDFAVKDTRSIVRQIRLVVAAELVIAGVLYFTHTNDWFVPTVIAGFALILLVIAWYELRYCQYLLPHGRWA